MSKRFRPQLRLKSERIWQYMDEKNLTEAKFAKKVGIRRETLDRLLNGHHGPDTTTRELLMKTTRLEWHELFQSIQER